ncbi:MAG: uroporphyrinogen-III synthase [Pseudomonadota bacterium]
MQATVLVTRPREQAEALIDLLNQRGWTGMAFPVLDIAPRSRNDIEADAAARGEADTTVFISPNAVRHGFEYASGRIAAIGPGTARAIEKLGASVDIVPKAGFDSEHLLEEDDFESLTGRRIRIVRGVGGRELLKETLEARGADVHYVEVYSRELPAYPDDAIEDLERRWLAGEIDFVVVMSVQSFNNLRRLLPNALAQSLAGCVLVTPAARVIKEAEAVYPGEVAVLADGTSAADIAEAIANAIGAAAAG